MALAIIGEIGEIGFVDVGMLRGMVMMGILRRVEVGHEDLGFGSYRNLVEDEIVHLLDVEPVDGGFFKKFGELFGEFVLESFLKFYTPSLWCHR